MALQRCGRGESTPRRQAKAASKERKAAPKLMEGEGSMVLRRTVRRRRRWSKALAVGGPSIPLPVHKQEKQPLAASSPPMALLVLLPRPAWARLIPPRLLGGGHRRPHAFLSVGDQLSRILG